MREQPKKRQGPIGVLLDPTDFLRGLQRTRPLMRAIVLALVVALLLLIALSIWLLRVAGGFGAGRHAGNSPVAPALPNR
ncbi:MAG: hypothetical protein ACT4QC_19890 [Planctomycetaceae bacterium]